MALYDQPYPDGQLKGLKVVDMTRVLAGPFCTMLLADMGAEVIKVEEPDKGDDARGYPPFIRGTSAYFTNLNRNKQSIVLNLKKQEAREILLNLLKKSDILLENFKPGTMDKLGLGYEVVSAANPRIIYASISGFGQYGPYKDRPGYDIIGQAMGGLMSVSGWPDSPPTRTGTAMADIVAGLNACVGILASLKGRERTGKGERIDVSLVDSMVSAMETIIQIYLVEGRVPRRVGNRYEFIAPYNSFAAADGWVVIGVGGQEVWKRFCKVINREDLIDDPAFLTNKDRVENVIRLEGIVTDWTSQRNVNAIVSLLMAASVPCSPILNVEQICKDPHIAKAREMIVEMDHPLDGKMKVVSCPIKFTNMKTTIRSTAPLQGEHTEQILTNVLGISREEYVCLKEKGIAG
ncbi:MAG: Formyl-coenzyme A transferase [Smithella sp. PtaU1.Bin162]|nr:MAG: Formyl-coenzyme A transferase [Smithella sp. PtaU1.Bin162]